MAQRDGEDALAERLGGISLDTVGGGEGKATIGPAGLIHKVRDVTPALGRWLMSMVAVSSLTLY